MIKILNPFRFVKGAGEDPPTPELVPPRNQNLRKSISIVEIVDMLCEGPIYGLVDPFGRKIYGLDMLKGVYLNGNPVMNYAGEYNYRNVLMEINLGTENQKPLANFSNVNIFKPANFKLLGPIVAGEQDTRTSANDERVKRDFVAWARQPSGSWPNTPQDSFKFVHHVKNKDVKKLKISLIVEALFDTVSEGKGSGDAGDLGMSKETFVELNLKWGVEGSDWFFERTIRVAGTVLSPYAYMIGEGEAEFDAVAGAENYSEFTTTVALNSRNVPSSTIDTRIAGAINDAQKAGMRVRTSTTT